MITTSSQSVMHVFLYTKTEFWLCFFFREFMRCHRLRFLGLCLTQACKFDRFKDNASSEYVEELVVSNGTTNMFNSSFFCFFWGGGVMLLETVSQDTSSVTY